MNSKEFAQILVEEVVDSNPPNSVLFLEENGINTSNLNNADEIWKVFVRYNIDAYGVKSGIVWKYWNQLPDNSLIKQKGLLLKSIESLKHFKCYENFTNMCPIEYKSRNFIHIESCYNNDNFNHCPVIILIEELKWHRAHYRIAKIIVECAKRLLVEDINGKKDGNINDTINGIFELYTEENHWKEKSTKELLSKFDNIKGYGKPPKVITWMLSELSSPVHQVNHWPYLDYKQLNPVDTHVKRLIVRFGFLKENETSSENIDSKLLELYPEEPRKLDYGLYRLGADLEENICGKTPNCEKCKEKFPKLYENCLYVNK